MGGRPELGRIWSSCTSVTELLWFLLPRPCPAVLPFVCRIGVDVRKRTRRLWRSVVLVSCVMFLGLTLLRAEAETPGHSIGAVATRRRLIVLELPDGAMGKPNLFDRVGRTVGVTLEGSRHRVENDALQWASDFGPELAGVEVTLRQFASPFSGTRWDIARSPAASD